LMKSKITGMLFVILFFFGLKAGADIPFRWAVIPDNPQPGEPVTIGVISAASPGSGGAVSGNVKFKTAALLLNGKRHSRSVFFPVQAEDSIPFFMAAVITIPVTARPGRAVIAVETDAGIAGEIPLLISRRDFVSEVIELDDRLTGIRTTHSSQRTAESNHLWAIFNKVGNEVHHNGKFISPVNSNNRTSFFGDRRVFKYSNGTNDPAIHAGIDYGIPIGTEVISCGHGRVVLARPRIVTGNSVIIEHLPGIYSLYYHLDSINVKEGEFVAMGNILGLSGSTGLSTEPHLHWEIRVFGESTDPDAFLSRPIIDKEVIFNRMNNQ
jgi:murein DD-endopeptidase MepM/ murein hydrolase activator NlpD